MRKKLKPFINQRLKLQGVLVKYGVKEEYVNAYIVTILIRDVCVCLGDSSTLSFDHVWIPATLSIAKKTSLRVPSVHDL